MRRAVVLALGLGAVAGCGGTTGSGLVTFHGAAAGPARAVAGQPFAFHTGDATNGYDVTLTRARLHIGGVYLNASVPTSGAAESSCVLPGIYVAELFGPVDVDLLSPEPVPFPNAGHGTVTAAAASEVWLTGGPVDALDDPTVILDVAGSASRGAQSWAFSAAVTIGQNRARPVQNPALPGSHPICHQRIVSPIVTPAGVDLTPRDGGTLTLRVDPSAMFNGVDFASLPPPSGDPPLAVIPDSAGGVGGALFGGLTSRSVYQLSWNRTGDSK